MDISHRPCVGDVEELQELIRSQSEIIRQYRENNKHKISEKSLDRSSRMVRDENRTAICAPIVCYDSQFYNDCDYKNYVASVRKEYFEFDETGRC